MQFHRFVRGLNATGQQRFVGENPPDGAIITNYAAGGQNSQIEVLDQSGKLIRRLDPPPGASGGVHRVLWDLRYAPPFTGAQPRGAVGFDARGPFVMPGEYQVRLKVGDQEQRRTVQVKGDPMISLSDANRKTWHDTLVSLSRLVETARGAQTTVERLQARLDGIRAVLAMETATPQPVAQAMRAFGEELSAIRKELLERDEDEGVARTPGPPGLADQIRQVYSSVEAATAVPTADQRRIVRDSLQRLTVVVERLNKLSGPSLAALHGELDKAGVRWTQGRTLVVPSLTLPPPQP